MAFPLTVYIKSALELGRYDKMEDGSFAGEIPRLKGVVAFGRSLRGCESELWSTLEDWILVGLRLGHKLPVLGGIDLNKQKAEKQGQENQSCSHSFAPIPLPHVLARFIFPVIRPAVFLRTE